jgi:ATP-binding cassette subfamily B protein/ATP-binding cassette subfamily C protein/ATP-binding cassette subfamily B multidrug efflux pump
MQPDSSQQDTAANKTPPVATAGSTRRAIALLLHAAAPERRHLVLGGTWLVVAALLEALGPLIGKYFIDHYLLPRNLVLQDMSWLLGQHHSLHPIEPIVWRRHAIGAPPA